MQYTRNELRMAYADAWRRHREGLPLTALDAMICDIIDLHPDYQALVEDVQRVLELQADLTGASANPFIHMGLHIAVREQVSIDRPPGVKALHERLRARCGNPHAADHVLMEALAETLWEAERSHRSPDTDDYLRIARKRMGEG